MADRVKHGREYVAKLNVENVHKLTSIASDTKTPIRRERTLCDHGSGHSSLLRSSLAEGSFAESMEEI
jgi:hypothetical protein